MKFDKETLIAFVVCMVIMLAWPSISQYFGWSSPVQEETAAETVAAKPAETKAAPAAAAAETAAAKPAETKAVQPDAKVNVAPEMPAVVLSNDDIVIDIDPVNGMISRITYRKYKHAVEGKDISVVNAKYGIFQLTSDKWRTVGTPQITKTADSCTIVREVATLQGKLQIIQTFTLPSSGYQLKCSASVRNMEKRLMVLDMTLSAGEVAPWQYVSGDKIRAVSHNLDYMTAGNDVETVAADDDDDDFFRTTDGKLLWIAGSNKYFCNIMDFNGQPFTMWRTRYYLKGEGDKDYPVLATGAKLAVQLPADGKFDIEARLYSGPKQLANIDSFIPSAKQVMHLAWGPINYLARFLLWILNIFYGICHSYGWSIILLTVLVRAVFYPLTARGNESMKKMQKVQPLFKELREKYKDNPQLLNQKMTELYRKEGVNPLAGCLPILLQIPIFFALYAMLDNAVALRHVPFYWCKNLAAADTIFTIPIFSWSLPVNPLVLAMTALMVVQQRMTPAAMDPAQKKMMALMPIVMLIFLYDLPSGLTLYWTVSNIFSIIQLWLQKRNGQTPVAKAGN